MKEKIQALPLRTKLNILYLLCGIGALITMLGCQISKPHTLHFVAWFGIALMAAGLVFRIFYIKCPHCGDGLYHQHNNLKRCRNCGKKLE